MNTLSTIRTTSLLLGVLLSSGALAHPAPYSHYHPAPAKKKVVYRTTPTPPSSPPPPPRQDALAPWEP